VTSPIAIVNARVATGDPRRPWADALLVREGRFVLVGSSAEVKKLASADVRVIDARRQLVTARPDARAAGHVIARGEPASCVIVRGEAAGAGEDDMLLELVDGRVVRDRMDDR